MYYYFNIDSIIDDPKAPPGDQPAQTPHVLVDNNLHIIGNRTVISSDFSYNNNNILDKLAICFMHKFIMYKYYSNSKSVTYCTIFCLY